MSMLKSRMKSVCVMALTIILLTSCASNRFVEPPIDFDQAYLNEQIKLFASKKLNTFENTDSVAVELFSNTSNEIVFPNNYGIRLFTNSNGQWTEVYEEPTDRYPSGNITLSLKNNYQIVVFYPKIDNIGQKNLLRVYVIGTMYSRQGEVDVAAYTDILLYP